MSESALAQFQRNLIDNSLWEAARDGNVADLKQALNDGADVNCRGIGDKTPMHWIAEQKRVYEGDPASTKDYTACADMLLARNADLSVKDQHGKTPVDLAEDSVKYATGINNVDQVLTPNNTFPIEPYAAMRDKLKEAQERQQSAPPVKSLREGATDLIPPPTNNLKDRPDSQTGRNTLENVKGQQASQTPVTTSEPPKPR